MSDRLSLAPNVVLIDMSEGGVLMDAAHPMGAFVNPTALEWLRGRPPADTHRPQFTHAAEQWHTAGLLTDSSGQTRPEESVLPREALTIAGRIDVAARTLVIAMSASCGFCAQLDHDLAANASVFRGTDVSVLLADGDDQRVLGLPIQPGLRQRLAGLAAMLADSGTPGGVLLGPGSAPRGMLGYPAVCRAVVDLTGADPADVVVEAPTACSVTVTRDPVDVQLAVPVAGRTLGVAVHGTDLAAAVADWTGGAPVTSFVPTTVTVRRPGSLYLLFRGGSLVARLRTTEELRAALTRLLAGFGPPEAGTVAMLCGAAVWNERQAVLFPRSWMTHWTSHAGRLARNGWRLRPDAHMALRPQPHHSPQLHDPTGGHPVPVVAALTEPLTPPAPHGHARLLTRIVNWTQRPTTAAALRAVTDAVSTLPIHTATSPQALTHLATHEPHPAAMGSP